MIALVLGGARSGKSGYAQRTAAAGTRAPVLLATSRQWSADHAERLARHRAERGPEWTTVEEATTLARPELAGRVVVVDCVTMWLTNLFADNQWNHELALVAAREGLERAFDVAATWIFVSSELGMAPQAPAESARDFVDVQGLVNQQIAARADSVVLMVAGIPLVVKGHDLRGLDWAGWP